MKNFPSSSMYQSTLISSLKHQARVEDKLKKNWAPFVINCGSVSFLLPRHFGFCYGVENAIDITSRAIEENPDKRIYLLGELIHNPYVNNYFIEKGVKFLMDVHYNPIVDLNSLSPEDIVIIPAFGAPLWVEEDLHKRKIECKKYQSTCPFVERVWNKAELISEKGYSVVIHGTPKHEETESTRSRIDGKTPYVIVKNIKQAEALIPYIQGDKTQDDFERQFQGQFSIHLDISKDFKRIGVINQTTMLASETQQIIDLLKKTVVETQKVTLENEEYVFAKTRDTLCYATNDNQKAIIELLDCVEHIDLAFALGGYNSSNTSHLVELVEHKTKTYYIEDDSSIKDENTIHHFGFKTKEYLISYQYLQQILEKIEQKKEVNILIFGGASCPDVLIEKTIEKIVRMLPNAKLPS